MTCTCWVPSLPRELDSPCGIRLKTLYIVRVLNGYGVHYNDLRPENIVRHSSGDMKLVDLRSVSDCDCRDECTEARDLEKMLELMGRSLKESQATTD